MMTTIKSIHELKSGKDDLLLVIDVQNDFVTGKLGNKDAEAAVENIIPIVKNFKGKRIFTRDTHDAATYASTEEGKNLPILHTEEGTWGWQIISPLQELMTDQDIIFNKHGLGCPELAHYVAEHKPRNIYVVGLDTGYCVISNVIAVKTFWTECTIHVIACACACASEHSHYAALDVMNTLWMDIIDLEKETEQ